MLIVIVDFVVLPENLGLALATLKAEAPIARALPGNLGYAIRTDPDHAGAVRLMHEWSDAASFAANKATPTFKTAGAVLFPLIMGKPSSRTFEATEVI